MYRWQQFGFIVIISLIWFEYSFAESSTTANYQMNNPGSGLSWIVTLTGGAAFANQVGQNQTLIVTEGNKVNENIYVTQSQTVSAIAGILLGVEYPVRLYQHNFAWQVGVGYYTMTPFSTSGIASFPLYDVTTQSTYQYKVQSQQLLLESKLFLPLATRWYPYLSLGLGTAFNKAYNYQETPLDGDNTGSLLFTNQQNTNFTYAIGAGLDVAVMNALRIGLAYRFEDLGAANLNAPASQATSATLKQEHLYTQLLLLQASYLF